jgi:hypothetical protein
MRKLLMTVVLLAQGAVFAQQSFFEQIKEDWDFRAYGLYPIRFGDNALAKAHETGGGYGVNVSPFSYKNFSLSAGLEVTFNEVTDPSKIGNIEYANTTSLFGMLKYKWPVSKQFEIYPDAGFGYVILKQIGEGRRFGHQDGVEFRLGFTTNYRVSKTVSFFIGARYIYSHYEVATNAEYQKFFSRANQLQLSAGIQLD